MQDFLKKIVRPILKKVLLYDWFYNFCFKILEFYLNIKNHVLKQFFKTAIILTYHRIQRVKNDPYQLCVDPDLFEKHLQFLQENNEVISLPELLTRLKNKSLSGREVVITFDDGYLDNYINAYPLLRRYNMPATIFVTTGFLGEESNFSWDNSYSPEDKAFFLKKDEVAALAKDSLITIGAHTHTHPRLSDITLSEQAFELRQNKKILENLINKSVSLLAFPFGGRFDITKNTVSLAAQEGFSAACTTEPTLITDTTNIHKMPRINIRNYSIEIFSKKIFHVS